MTKPRVTRVFSLEYQEVGEMVYVSQEESSIFGGMKNEWESNLEIKMIK